MSYGRLLSDDIPIYHSDYFSSSESSCSYSSSCCSSSRDERDEIDSDSEYLPSLEESDVSDNEEKDNRIRLYLQQEFMRDRKEEERKEEKVEEEKVEEERKEEKAENIEKEKKEKKEIEVRRTEGVVIPVEEWIVISLQSRNEFI